LGGGGGEPVRNLEGPCPLLPPGDRDARRGTR
jgi:hypothetical protein